MRMKVDCEWPTDTTQSEDIGVRRGSVFRLNGAGVLDVADRKHVTRN